MTTVTKKDQILFCINAALESDFKMNDLFMTACDNSIMKIEFA